MIRVTMAINPVPQARPRTIYGKNGKVWSFIPRRTVQAQEELQARFERYKGRGFAPHVPVKLSVTFYRVKSKQLTKRETLPFRKPDLDNFLKLVLDSMNGILVADDAQITTIACKKRWSENGTGHITIKLEEDKDGYTN